MKRSPSRKTLRAATGERTWLTSHTPAAIAGRPLLISAALDITSRKQVEQKLAQHAFFDDLTGLPNRFLINERVDEALRRDGSHRFALAFIDLDNFKHINDYYSHVVGDALLVKVAERIRKTLRDTDMLARISGDEFLLLIEPLADEEQARIIVNALLDALKQPFHIEAFEVFTSASIGVSIYPEHGATYEVLRRNADNAMYRAKSGHKGEAVFFDSGIGERMTAHMELEQRLRLAIRDRKFCCAFQPKVDLHTHEVVGFETLVRWRDEAGEIHAPGSFIGLATELGLIDPITHFVLAEAISSIERLDQAFGGRTTISINVAAKQAGDMTFMSSLAQVLKDSRYAERFMLELTEDAFVAKSQFQTQVLPMLRELGVRVSIDDFGTGYSSLSVLADITADEIKVDRSFITAIHQRPRSQSVLRTIESLGLALGMSIVAEGIETFEELAYLQATSRIRYAQGFYFSKPFFLDEIKDARELFADGRSAEATRTNAQWRNPLASRESGRAAVRARIAAQRLACTGSRVAQRRVRIRLIGQRLLQEAEAAGLGRRRRGWRRRRRRRRGFRTHGRLSFARRVFRGHPSPHGRAAPALDHRGDEIQVRPPIWLAGSPANASLRGSNWRGNSANVSRVGNGMPTPKAKRLAGAERGHEGEQVGGRVGDRRAQQGLVAVVRHAHGEQRAALRQDGRIEFRRTLRDRGRGTRRTCGLPWRAGRSPGGSGRSRRCGRPRRSGGPPRRRSASGLRYRSTCRNRTPCGRARRRPRRRPRPATRRAA